MVNESGAAIFPQTEIATGGHQRRSSYTGLPPPSPPIAVNFGAVLNGQQSVQGVGGYPVPNYPHTEIATRGHQRRSSYTGLPPPSPQTMIMGGSQNNRGPDRHLMTQGSMRNNGHQRSWSSSTISASSPTMLLDESRTPDASQNGFSVNGHSGSPLLQSPMLNGGSAWNGNHQRRVSVGSAPLSSTKSTANGYGVPNVEQARSQADATSLASLSQSTLNGGNLENIVQQRHMPDSDVALQAPASMINGGGQLDLRSGQAGNHGKGNAPLPNSSANETINGASRPSTATLRANTSAVDSAVATCKQGRLDSSTNDPEAPQTPENRGKSVQVITLTRSGRTIGPTTIQNGEGSSKNTKAKAQANGITCSPGKATIAQRRNSKGKEDMHIVNMPPSRLTMPGKDNYGHHQRSRSPPAPAGSHVVGLGISNIEESEGHTNGQRSITAVDKSSKNGAEAPMPPPQANAQKAPSPPGQLPTPGTSSSPASNRGNESSISANRTNLSASSSFPPFPASTTPDLSFSLQAHSHAPVLRHANAEGSLHAYEEKLLETVGEQEDEHGYQIEKLTHDGNLDLGERIVGLHGAETHVLREELPGSEESRIDYRQKEADRQPYHRLAHQEQGVGSAVGRDRVSCGLHRRKNHRRREACQAELGHLRHTASRRRRRDTIMARMRTATRRKRFSR